MEFTEKRLIKKYDYSGGDLPVYIGYAEPGTGGDEAEWVIEKYFYTDSKATHSLLARSGATVRDHHKYNKVWDDRATYDYD